MFDPYATFESTVLPNGLTVVVSHLPDRPWEHMRFAVHSGAEQDAIGLEGTAHFLEHLMSRNAPLPSEQLRRFFEGLGGRVMLGTTGFPYTQYSFYMPREEETIRESLRLFGDMLLHSPLSVGMEEEREIIRQEFRRRFSMDAAYDLALLHSQILYADYPRARFTSPLGNLHSIDQISQDDVAAYYGAHYTPANMTVVCVGGMTLDDVIASLQDSPFSDRRPGNRTPIPVPKAEFAPLAVTRNVRSSLVIYGTRGQQTAHYFATTKVPSRIGYEACLLASNILHEILNDEIREKRQWSYAVGSKSTMSAHFNEISLEVQSMNLAALPNIDQVIEDCLARAVDSVDHFNQEKKRLIAVLKMIDLLPGDLAQAAANKLVHTGRISTLEELSAIRQALTQDDVRAVLQHLQPKRRLTTIWEP